MNQSIDRKTRQAATHDFKRRAIIDVARQIVDEQGPKALTVRTIAAAAGYSPGAVYSYFNSMEELAMELIYQDLNRLARNLKNAFNNEQVEGQSPNKFDTLVTLAQTSLNNLEHMGPLNHFANLVFDQKKSPPDSEQGRMITGRLLQILGIFQDAIANISDQRQKSREVLVFTCMILGLSLLQRSGRLDVLGFTTTELIDHYLEGR